MRISESLAKMRMAPFATETDVDEALRLFQSRPSTQPPPELSRFVLPYDSSRVLQLHVNFFFFFKYFLADACIYPILVPLVPLFWIAGDVSSGF